MHLSMGSPLDAGERNRSTYRGAPPARADRPEADTAHYIDRQGVISRLHSYPVNGYAMRHLRHHGGMTGRVWLAVVLIALALDTAVGAAVYFLLTWLWP